MYKVEILLPIFVIGFWNEQKSPVLQNIEVFEAGGREPWSSG